MNEPKNKWALITGASTGIGLELARQFALNGYDLVICSHTDKILDAQESLLALGVEVQAVKSNLASYQGVEKLSDFINSRGILPEVLVINAGVTHGGAEFVDSDLNEEINIINLNILSAIHLTKRILPLMYEQGSGKILFTSSISALLPGPYQSVYSASKAFLSSFAEAIRSEARLHGVTVTILMPGPTDTEIFEKGGMEDTLVGSKLRKENDPVEVAAQGFKALMAGKEKIIAATLKTKLQGLVAGYLPDRLKTQLHRHFSEPLDH